jgi:HAD superfamily hydrolase (TIGR01549 family)
MKSYKAIIYDIDNTLLNTLDMNMYPLIRIIKEETGEDWTFQQVLRFAVQPGLKTMAELGVQDIEKTYARWVAYVNAYEPGAIPYEGIEAVLQKIQNAGIRQAVVSSKMKGQYQIDMVENGLDVYMETAILVEDTTHHKPHPEPILKCLERMDLLPEDVIYIGDAPTDLLAAQNVGVDFGFAQWGSIQASDMSKAQYCFEKPEDVLHLIAE